MSRLWVAVVLALILVTGCSSTKSSTAMDGEEIYKESCAACHGDTLQGAVGPGLTNMKGKYSEAEVLNIVNEGTKKMPGNLLDAEKSEIVTKWLMEN
ncbi:cytochrome c [Neobacillus sp. MER 74]|uniref:c-type cytochrome n=1 Tax=Neobacillus sp. MER 74 TaxID=2939566 RepID=UPI0020418951|nr:cytochrome c [Neobacillus sp. MER 74]MCM3117227.1 cytochrome c [Neobacillus sp. MER 74]